MRQAAHYDLHTTEGLAQVQHLRFVLPSGEVDTQYNGMTIRGGVLVDVIQDMPGSEIIDGRCALQLPRLAAGCHRYDVLVSDDGTDKPLLAGVIHVAPRVTPVDVDDNAPADYLDIVIPADEDGTITVISDSPVWVDDAVEKSLQERGMYVNPVPGECTLTMSAGTNTRDFNYFTFALNSTYVSGHLAGSYKLNQIALRTPASEANDTRWMARLCKYSAGLVLPLEELGTSTSIASWSSINAATMECRWNFNGIAFSATDRLVLEVYAVDNSGTTISKALIAYGAAAAHGGTEGVLFAADGTLAWRNYSRLALSMSVTYDAGVSVGGIELASRSHFDALAAGVAEAGKQVADDADAAQKAKEDAEQIANGLTITTGTVTTGEPGSQAVVTLTPGTTSGSWIMDATIPRGDTGATGPRGGKGDRGAVGPQGPAGVMDTSQAYVWTQPQTYDAMINANGGINLPSMPLMDTDCANLAFVKAFNPAFISTSDYINAVITGDANRYTVYPGRIYCKDTYGLTQPTRCEITSLRHGADYEGSECVFIPCDILVKNRPPAQKISISWGGTVNSSQSVRDWDIDASAAFSLTIEILFQDAGGASNARSIMVRKKQMGGSQAAVIETDWLPIDAYPEDFSNVGDTALSIGLAYVQKSETWAENEGCLYFLCYHITQGRYYAFPLIRTHGKHNYLSRLSSPRIVLTNEAYGTAKAYGNVHIDAPIIYYGTNNAFYQFIASIEQ